MELIGDLKKKVENAETTEEAKEAVKGYMPAKLVERNTGALLKALQEVSE